ncbi:MAG: two-component regulator propeller domain-containing protein [Candidatus Latescibacterota bacterium]
MPGHRPVSSLLRASLLLPLLVAPPARGHSGQVCLARAVQGIVVDGQLDEWPADAPAHPIGRTEYGSPPTSPVDLRADFRVGYSAAERALYVAVVVQDESVRVDTTDAANWDTGDGCELYLHMDHQDDRAPVAQFAVYGTHMRIGSQRLARWAAVHGPDGHRYEWRLDVSSLVADGDAGLSLGADVVVTDSDADGSYSWLAWSRGLRKFESAARLGDLVLVSGAVDTGHVRGRLHWAGMRKGVAQQKVQLQSHDWSRLRVTAVTDDSGRFTAVLPAGRYAVDTWAMAGPVGVEAAAGRGTEVLVPIGVPEGSAVAAGPGTLIRQVRGVRYQAWHHIGAPDGLPTGASALCQTRDGNVWIGALGTLCRYDGQDVLVLTAADGVPDAEVEALVEDGEANLWVGTSAGLCRYDGRRFTTFTAAHGLIDERVRAVARDARGNVWIGTEGGLGRYADHHFTSFTTQDGLANNLVTSLEVGRDGSVWAGTEGGLCRWDGQRFSSLTAADGLLDNQVYGVAEDSLGRLWVGTRGGVSRYDGARFTVFTSNHGAPDVPPGEVVRGALLADGAGDVWVGTATGLVRFGEGGLHAVAGHEAMPTVAVRSLLEDSEGNVWIGTAGGVSRHDARAFTRFTAAEGLADDHVLCLLRDHRGALWAGTEKGLSWYHGGVPERWERASDVGDATVTCLLEDHRDRLWAGVVWHGRGAGLMRLDGQSAVPVLSLSKRVYAMAETRNGDLWLGAHDGLYRYDGQRASRFTVADGLPADYVTALLVTRDDLLWIGTERGVCRYDGTRFSPLAGEAAPLRGRVPALAEDGNGVVWVGTARGVFRVDGERLVPLPPDHQVSSGINALLFEGNGTLCMGTSEGLARYDGQVTQTLLRRDGLGGNDVRDLVQDAGGRIWVGTFGQGVTCYAPRRTPPFLRLSDAIADRHYGPAPDLELAAPVNLLAFEFHGLSFRTRPGGTVYRYRLHGHDAQWRTTGLTHVEYRGLPRGRYDFEVQAVDRDLNYSQALLVAVQVRPPYGRMALFGLLGLALGASVWLGVQGVRRARWLRESLIARRSAEAASAAKSQFLAHMSHELRTPMNAILGMTDLALAEALSPRLRDYLQTSKESADLLLGLLDEVLDMSRIEAGRFALEEAPFDLRRTVEQVVSALRAPAREKGLALECHLPPELPPCVVGDALRLTQVVMNLVGNAIKFTPQGEVRVRLTVVEQTAARSVVRFEVRDTGIGIAPQDHERIFASFTQVDSTVTRPCAGAGLGLAIAQRLVGFMGGNIEVDSAPGRGSTFSFTLVMPVAPAEVSALRAPRTAPARLSAPVRPARVLLAEDTPGNRKLVVYLLERRGHHVAVAADGRAAVELLQSQEFDVVLMGDLTAAIEEVDVQLGLLLAVVQPHRRSSGS